MNALWAQLLIEECCRAGVTYFCVAPGSRSSPLAVAVASHPSARTVVALDERSLGFHALGYGRASGRPAAVISSSGTAVGNLLPAVMEASEGCVPLLVLTGDRPSEMRDSGSNQTTDQLKIFGSFVRWAGELAAPENSMSARVVLTTVDLAVRQAQGGHAGPVHLNISFREPLAPTAAPWSSLVLTGLGRWEASRQPFTSHILAHPRLCSVGPIPALLASTSRGLIVAGGLDHPQDSFAVAQLSMRLGWPIVADPASGLRVNFAGAPVISHMDYLLLNSSAFLSDFAPEVILQIGGRITSKRVSSFLERSMLEGLATSWIFVERHPRRHDPSHLQTHRVEMEPATFTASVLHALEGRQLPAEQLASQKRFTQTLVDVSRAASREISTVLHEIDGLTEPYIARTISERLPDGEGLFIGNSMPIRDLDFFSDQGSTAPDGSSPSFRFGTSASANRGVSGIDGVVSSAAGFAAGLGRPSTLLIGDVSFCHDVNGLFFLRQRMQQPRLVAIVINNGGGGIFNFLPISQSVAPGTFTTFFSTPPGIELREVCRAHGVPHESVSSKADFSRLLSTAWSQTHHLVLEVFVPPTDKNVTVHRQVEAGTRYATARALYIAREERQEPPLAISSASYRRYRLPLASKLTSGPREESTRKVGGRGGRRAAG